MPRPRPAPCRGRRRPLPRPRPDASPRPGRPSRSRRRRARAPAPRRGPRPRPRPAMPSASRILARASSSAACCRASASVSCSRGLVLGRCLGGLGRLDVLDQVLLRLGLGRDDDRLPRSARPPRPTRRRLMLSSCSATVFSTAMRSRITSAIAALLDLELLLLGDRGQLGLALAGDHLEHPVLLDPLGLDRDDPLAVLLRDRDLAGLVLPLDAELLLGARCGAISALSRSSACTRAVSASSRARTVSISRFCLISASACRRSSSRIASRASTFCRVISFSSLRWNSLVRTCSIAVSSVIFRMPWASRMLLRVELSRSASARGSRSPRPRGCSR